ncbi:MAG: fatty acid desaturase, partial [Cystobacter sp.]
MTTAAAHREDTSSPRPVFPDVDAEAFSRDLQALRDELESALGPEDRAHFEKIQRWGRLCTGLGYATAWVMPNPLSAMLIAQGNTARWTMMAHHVTHRGYDRVPGMPEQSTNRRFATGWRRFLDWPDWIHPDAWRHEHNTLHHVRTGETADPDLVEHNTEWLRRSSMPLWTKYGVVAFFACTWKVTYYAPNTFFEWRRAERRRAGGPEEVGTPPLLEAFNPLSAEGRLFWKTCLLPYAGLRFALVPALFAPLGAWSVFSVFANSVFAELLTNLQSFMVIAPNHAGDDLYRFEGRVDSRAAFAVRQVVG